MTNTYQTAVATAYATESDAESIGRLFSAYRTFYEREPDDAAAKRYIGKRLRSPNSLFIKAVAHDRIVGFAHLSEMLDTLEMRDAWMLEDLFVDPAHRARGVASALLERARAFARNTNGSRISLTTAHTNAAARKLYESHGYERDENFSMYHLWLDA